MEKLLRTLRKEKLPAGFGYPASATLLSNALIDVPQFESIELSFIWRQFGASAWNKAIKEKLEIAGLRVMHSPRFSWSMSLYALPSDHCAPAREALGKTVLPALRSELNSWTNVDDCFTWSAKFSLSTSTYKFHIGW